MADERDKSADEAREEELDRLEQVGRTTVKVAASAVLASTLASALAQPPHAEMMSLPEPTPIVQMYQAVDDDPLDDEEDEQDESQSRWRRILKVLKLLFVALALVGTIALGVLKGCAGIAGSLLLPPGDERQEESAPRTTSTEDERGVAVDAGI